jgi:hypothetical protein
MVPGDVFEPIPGGPTAADIPDRLVGQRRVEQDTVGQFFGWLVLVGWCPEESGDLFGGQWRLHFVAFRLRRENTVGPSLTRIFWTWRATFPAWALVNGGALIPSDMMRRTWELVTAWLPSICQLSTKMPRRVGEQWLGKVEFRSEPIGKSRKRTGIENN